MTSAPRVFLRNVSLATALALAGLGPTAPALAQEVPGGLIEKASSTVIRPVWTASQIQAFLPARGRFTFPAPYQTEGIRLTNASDCGGSDCVQSVGYSYWRNINNHRGSDTMLVFLGLRGAGPTLFSYNKVTDEVRKVGPLFDASSPYAGHSGEGWYFSATRPTSLYVSTGGPRLLRYDVVARTFETVFDVTARFGGDKYIWQTHSSDDDAVHSATLRQTGTWANLGCLAYRESSAEFLFYPSQGDYDECQVDKSGRWLVIKENMDGLHGEDDRIIDLETGSETLLLDQDGAAGHSDTGHGYMVAEDNWHGLPGAVRVWRFDASPLQGFVAYHATSWGAGGIGHVAHSNAQPGEALLQQYVCGGSATTTVAARANEIFCFRLDGSLDVLVVTQNMTNLAAAGGGDVYSKRPKGNLDVTGSYFIWATNMGGSRNDAFMVKIPRHRLTGAPADTTPPSVSITEPPPSSTVNGMVTVSALAADDTGVTAVQFKLDGADLGEEVTSPPYAMLWDTSMAANGAHTLTAQARDAAGNTSLSAGVTVTVSTADASPPVIASVSSAVSTSGTTITWTTNEPSDSQVEYGPTTAYGSSSTLDPGLLVAHAQVLSGLAGGTLYHYRVKSRDAAGNLALSADHTFTTAASAAGLMAHLELDEGGGQTAADASGNGHAGTLMNGARWTAGPLGQAVALDGLDDYVRIPHAARLNAFPLSVSVWFRTTSATGVRGLVNKYVANSNNGYQLFFNNGDLCGWYLRDGSNFVYDGGGCTLRTSGYNDGVWHHAVLVVDAQGGRLYVDGTQKATQPWTGQAGAASTTQEVHLGHYPGAFGGAEYLPGAIDDVRLYDQALSAAEVLRLYDDGQFADVDPPVLAGVGLTALGATEATIVWSTDEPADTQVEYGPSSAYGSSTALDPARVTAHTRGLAGLTPSTLYHYRVKSRDAAGNLAVSADLTFTTLDDGPPIISAVSASNVTSSGATITWTTHELADSQVEYGTTTAYGMSTAVDPGRVTSHTAPVTGLTPATQYHYRVKSRDAAGNLAVSGDFTFTTKAADGDASLVVDLKLDDGAGTVAADTSGHGHAGALVNGALWTVGITGPGVTLDGVDDYVRVPHATTLNAFPLSLSVWFKTSTTAGVRGVVGKYVAGSYNGYQVFFNDGSLCAWYLRDTSNHVYDGSTCTMRAAGYNDGRWHHAVFVVDAAGGRLYVDGAEKGHQAWTGTAGQPTTLQELRLGHYPGAFGGAEYLPGVIDEARVYGRALSAAEVVQVYEGSRSAGDSAPPLLSAIGVVGLAAVGATIVWTTDEPADAQVEYGLTPAYGSSTALAGSLVVSHSVVLTGLLPGTAYHYRVKSRDAAGNLALSPDTTFTTLSLPLLPGSGN